MGLILSSSHDCAQRTHTQIRCISKRGGTVAADAFGRTCRRKKSRAGFSVRFAELFFCWMTAVVRKRKTFSGNGHSTSGLELERGFVWSSSGGLLFSQQDLEEYTLGERCFRPNSTYSLSFLVGKLHMKISQQFSYLWNIKLNLLHGTFDFFETLTLGGPFSISRDVGRPLQSCINRRKHTMFYNLQLKIWKNRNVEPKRFVIRDQKYFLGWCFINIIILFTYYFQHISLETPISIQSANPTFVLELFLPIQSANFAGHSQAHHRHTRRLRDTIVGSRPKTSFATHADTHTK